MSFGMSPKLVCAAAAALMLSTVVSQASEATLLADRAGFLLGHAHRCGIEDARLQPLGNGDRRSDRCVRAR